MLYYYTSKTNSLLLFIHRITTNTVSNSNILKSFTHNIQSASFLILQILKNRPLTPNPNFTKILDSSIVQNYPSTNDDNHRRLSVAWSRVRGLEILGSRELSNNASNPRVSGKIHRRFRGLPTPIAVFDRSWSIDGTGRGTLSSVYTTLDRRVISIRRCQSLAFVGGGVSFLYYVMWMKNTARVARIVLKIEFHPKRWMSRARD